MIISKKLIITGKYLPLSHRESGRYFITIFNFLLSVDTPFHNFTKRGKLYISKYRLKSAYWGHKPIDQLGFQQKLFDKGVCVCVLIL